MKLGRILYRLGQFWQALADKPNEEDLKQARAFLSPAQMRLFVGLQPGEQAHCLKVFNQLRLQQEFGSQQGDFLTAALLHDIGKCCCPMYLWERVWIVLGKALFPQQIVRWGSANYSNLLDVPFWQRPFIVAVQHPKWGAEMAAEAGASPLTVSIIRRHQDKVPIKGVSLLEERLIQKLQAADDSY
jgi:putative nucleotidyltransferase with HDIG domain